MADTVTNQSTAVKEAANLCNVVRKWNLRFDGYKDPISFLERLEELVTAYDIDRTLILKALPELLTGAALLWYRNFKDSWTTFESFRQSFEVQFLPLDYRRNLDDEIRRRTQGESEPFRSFLIALTTLIRRRGGFSRQEELDRIYTNMRPDYKLTIRRGDTFSIEQLLQQAEHVENCERERSLYRPPPPPSMALVPETAYNPRRRPEKNLERPELGGLVTCETGVPRSGAPTPTGVRFKEEDHPKKLISFTPPQPSATGISTSNEKSRERQSEDKTFTAICWNCNQKGHLYRQCRLPKALKCFNCKKEGVKTHECGCQAGNGFRTRRNGDRTSPK